MELKQCPQCNRYSVSYDFNLGIEMCRWRDCSWVNTEHLELPVAHTTVVISSSSQTGIKGGEIAKAWEDTVISQTQIWVETRGNVDIRSRLLTQAELTWHARDKKIAEARKAGYEQGLAMKPDPDRVYENGKQDGIREVVEFINRLAIFTAETAKEGEPYTYLGSYILKWGKEDIPSYGFAPFDECPEWQAKLKSWNISA